jgi:hypothetical protein
MRFRWPDVCVLMSRTADMCLFNCKNRLSLQINLDGSGICSRVGVRWQLFSVDKDPVKDGQVFNSVAFWFLQLRHQIAAGEI